jgi:hypothetical protein
MATRVVNSEAEAAAIVVRLESRLRDMTDFFETLEKQSGALDVAEREVWDRRFGIGIRHHESTIEARRDRTGYYKNPKGSRATASSPMFEWSGALREAASKFTTIEPHRAVIDPDANYRGPLAGVVPNPFSDIVEAAVGESNIFDERILGGRIERDLSAHLFKVLSA